MDETKGFLASKINWTQIVMVIAMLLAMFGIDVPADVQKAIVAALISFTALITIVMRTWFTNKRIKAKPNVG